MPYIPDRVSNTLSLIVNMEATNTKSPIWRWSGKLQMQTWEDTNEKFYNLTGS